MPHLLCIDFDGTLIEGNSHNLLSTLGIKPGDAQLTHIEPVKFRYPELMCEIIRKMLTTGNHVAILSFNNYPEIIKPVLQEMGLSESESNKIYILGGFPKEGPSSPYGKNEHIDSAKKHFSIENNADVTLIDDTYRNILAAELYETYNTVFVPAAGGEIEFSTYDEIPAPKYICDLFRLIHCKLNNIPLEHDAYACSSAQPSASCHPYYSSSYPGTPYSSESLLSSCSSQERSLGASLSPMRSPLRVT